MCVSVGLKPLALVDTRAARGRLLDSAWIQSRVSAQGSVRAKRDTRRDDDDDRRGWKSFGKNVQFSSSSYSAELALLLLLLLMVTRRGPDLECRRN